MASAALLVSSVATMAATNLVTNGSFESPTLTPGSDYLIASVGSGTITSWAVVGSPGQNVAMIEALYNLPDAAGINFAAADGVQWIDMTGAGSNSTEALQQSVTLAPGIYTLSFYVGNVVAAAAGLGTQSTVDLWLNSSFVQSFTNSGSGGAGINWQQFSHSFNAGGLTSIEFRNGRCERPSQWAGSRILDGCARAFDAGDVDFRPALSRCLAAPSAWLIWG
jgi:hypothetical protein